VSQHVSALERETGTALLERAGRGIRPTDAGLLLCDHATRVLDALQEAEEALAELRAGHIGRVRLGAFPTAGSSLVPDALAAFQRLHPSISLDLTVAETDEALAGLRSGTLDLVVVVEPLRPGEVAADGLVRHHLLSDPFRLVLPRDHPLARRRSVELARLAGERWIGVRSCPGYCQQVVEDVCGQAGFRPRYALEADEYPTAQGFVAAGLGVALVPLLALGASAHPGVAVRQVKDARPVREVWAVSRPAIVDQPPVAALLASLREVADRFGRAAA
jgi:DNA-binding transcriptional LysR family regulator